MLQRLNKDLLIKLIENINDPRTLGVEELKNRMKIYEQIIKERETKERIEDVKRLVWELRNVGQFKEIIENNKEEIEKLDFDFSDFKKSCFTDDWILTKILYNGKYLSFKDLFASKEALFSLRYAEKGGIQLFWRHLIHYIYDDRWDFYMLREEIKDIKSINYYYKMTAWLDFRK